MRVASRPLLNTAVVAILAVATLGLSACAPLPSAAPARIAARTFAPAFELQGRISASAGEQAASGSIDWRHAHGTDSFTLLTPLGQIAAQLEASAVGAHLRTADGQELSADSAETLLPHVPDAAAEVRNRDSAGRPALVIDQGWRIEYLAYLSTAADSPPARLDISRGDARIRLVIDSWTTLP